MTGGLGIEQAAARAKAFEELRAIDDEVEALGTAEEQMIWAWEKLVEHPFWGDCFGKEGTLIDAMLAKLTAYSTLGEPAVMSGQIRTASFEDGIEHEPYCGLDDCECPDHDGPPKPAGTYITIRLDEDSPIGLWRVKVTRDTAGVSSQ